jgi:putative ABC transport system substrate-binding protein
VSNLARPGGNITGFSLLSLELSSKRLELLKEIVPAVRRVGVLWNKGNAPVQFDATQAADGGLLSYGPSIAENFRHTAIMSTAF